MRAIWLLPVVAAAACGGGEAPVARAPAAAPAERLYRPPADGRLTERQVQAYLASLKAPRPAGREPDEGVVFDGRPASDEYLWVREKVLEAEMRLDERAAARREAEIDRKTAEALRGAAAASTDPATRDSIAKQIAELEKRAADREREARKSGDPAETANDAIVARYRRQAIPEAARP